ncbi:MAG: LamG domain-containing protein, partial [Deltaproteobacteria bacterium]|nr:LamG domain-containing protein [Deltaproteobacteria bacterium]
PIILAPTPNQILPPTRIFWNWRGEKDPDGGLVYPDQGYKVDFDIDNNLANGAFESTFVPSYNNISDRTSESSEHHVESEEINPNRAYKLRIRPVQNDSILSGFDATRVFLTDNSVVAWWNFYEGTGSIAGDVVGGYDGQLINFGGIGWSDGLIDLGAFTDRSLNFDGNDDFVDISHDPLLVPANLTLEAWVNPTRLDGCNGESCGILNKSSGGNGYRLAIDPSGTISFGFGDGVTGEANTASATLENGTDTWTHLAATHNGSIGALFQNGGFESSATAPLRDSMGNPNLQIGRDYPTGYFNGIIDEARIYNRAMDGLHLCNSYLSSCHSAQEEVALACDLSCIPD